MTGETGGSGLLERATELHRIDAALAAAAAGEPSVLIVEGAAGVGKTQVLKYARKRAAQAGIRVLAAAGGEFEREFAWGVIRQMLASHAISERVLAMEGAAQLARPVLEPKPALEPSASFAVLHGLYWAVANLAVAEPLALVVDDAHWLDDPSLRWLAFLAARVEGLRLLLLLGARPAKGDEAEHWTELVLKAEALPLRPLSSAGTRELLASRYGRLPADAFVDACIRATGGNPFLLSELLARLLSEGIAPDTAGAAEVESLPRNLISRTVSLRLRRLPAPELALAQAVAVLGDAADLRRSARLARLDEESASDAAARLAAAHVFADRDDLAFVHPLVRSAAHNDLPATVRSRWHAAVARLLDDDGFDIDQVAAHLLLAQPRGDAWAVERLQAAAAVARARGAADAAARYLERALREPPNAAQRPALLLELARARTAISPQAGAVAFGEALQAAADSLMRAEAAYGLGLALTFSGRFIDAADALEAALDEVGTDDIRRRAEFEAALLNTLRWDVETRDRSRALVERLKARAGPNERLDPRLHANLALELMIEGEDLAATLHHAEHALGGGELAAEQNAMWVPVLITPLAASDQLDRALASVEEVMAVARARGWRSIVAIATATRAKLRLWLGDVAGATADAEEALSNSDDVISAALAAAFLTDSLLERGEVNRAWEELDRRGLAGPLPAIWPFPWVQAARGRLRCLRGDVAGALDDLLGYGELAERYGLRNPAVESWRSDAALVCRVLGRPENALKLAREELALARAWGAPRPIGIALRTLGMLEERDRGVALLRESEELLAATPARLAHAASLTELGAALRRDGRRREAREALRQGLHVAAECGAIALAERARSEILAAGGRPRGAAMRGRDALTPSELRIARLAAKGLSNPEIAQTLFVTRRTVETHLTQAYRKLDITSREQLAASLT